MLTDTRVASIKPPVSGQEEHADAKVTGLRLRVGAGGQKTWILRKRVGAKTINKKLGTYPALSLAKARDDALSVIEALERNGASELVSRTFGDLVTDWLNKVAKPNNRSWRMQERRLELHVLPHWKERDLRSIKRGDIRDLVENIEGDVNPNRVLTLVRTLFRYALGRDWIEASPAEGIAKPKSEQSRDRVLDMAEVKRVYEAADLLGYPFTGFVQMLFLTGQRRTEVASMRWSDIDLENATWTIPAEASKSGRVHLVPLSATAVKLLEATPQLGDHVWTSDGESYVTGYSKAKSRLDTFIAAKGDALAPWVLHDVRRTVATHMVRLGVLEEVVGRVLNHARAGVTAKVYALHSYAPEKRVALDKWEADLLRELSGRKPGKVVKLRAEK